MAEYAIIQISDDIVQATLSADSESDAMLIYDDSAYYAKECKSGVNEQLGYNLDGKYARIGWKYDSSSEKYYEWPCPRTNFVLSSNKKWQAPSAPSDGFASPNYYHMSEEISIGYKWNDDAQEWVARTSEEAPTTSYSG